MVRSFLEHDGVLSHEDSLKTRVVMDACLPVQEEPQPAEPQPTNPEEPMVPGEDEAPHTPMWPCVPQVPTASSRLGTQAVSLTMHAPGCLGEPRAPCGAVPAGGDAPTTSEGTALPTETARPTVPQEHPADASGGAQQGHGKSGRTRAPTVPQQWSKLPWRHWLMRAHL